MNSVRDDDKAYGDVLTVRNISSRIGLTTFVQRSPKILSITTIGFDDDAFFLFNPRREPEYIPESSNAFSHADESFTKCARVRLGSGTSMMLSSLSRTISAVYRSVSALITTTGPERAAAWTQRISLGA